MFIFCIINLPVGDRHQTFLTLNTTHIDIPKDSLIISHNENRLVAAVFGNRDMFVTRVKHDAVLFRASLNASIMQKINRNNEHNQSVRLIVYEGKYGIRLI